MNDFDKLSHEQKISAGTIAFIMLSSGMTAETLLRLSTEYAQSLPKDADVKKPVNVLRCPQCAIPLVPVANYEGLKIVGCKKCRYSKILE